MLLLALLSRGQSFVGMDRQNNALTGEYEGELTEPQQIVWLYETNASIKASPIVAVGDGNIYMLGK